MPFAVISGQQEDKVGVLGLMSESKVALTPNVKTPNPKPETGTALRFKASECLVAELLHFKLFGII